MSNPDQVEFIGKTLVLGEAQGDVLYADTALSFMGGVNPSTGVIIDTHHPLRGCNIAGKILAIPSGRGSCGGSGVLFEMLLNGLAPAGLVFEHNESILTLGVIIAEELFQKSIPVVSLGRHQFVALSQLQKVQISGKVVTASAPQTGPRNVAAQVSEIDVSHFNLTHSDLEMLEGAQGEACRVAMRIILRAAALEEVSDLIDVEQAHIDGCYYTGPGSLDFAEKLCALGAQVKVPSSMNAISVDKRRWREHGVDQSFGIPSSQLADAYVRMGVKPTYTCAPYLLETAPTFGQQIVWAESNAVVYANSVLGARTMKYPDYLDICIALTGRAPLADCHIAERRLATVLIDVPDIGPFDDSFYPMLGYLIGDLATNDIPVIRGLENARVRTDDLKAMSAAFATTSASPMFHVVGVTPEASTLEQALAPGGPQRTIKLTRDDFARTWAELNSANDDEVDLISLGNPHFTFSEFESLAELCRGKRKEDRVVVIVTCGRDIFERAKKAGLVEQLEAFGIQFINDTCWCLIGEPVISPHARTIMTNSAKYAHYGTASLNRGIHFASLSACVEAACTGKANGNRPSWLM
jgi:cis-L-3-hydroxyproline dehydratase